MHRVGAEYHDYPSRSHDPEIDAVRPGERVTAAA
jgi:hypothetical protein